MKWPPYWKPTTGKQAYSTNKRPTDFQEQKRGGIHFRQDTGIHRTLKGRELSPLESDMPSYWSLHMALTSLINLEIYMNLVLLLICSSLWYCTTLNAGMDNNVGLIVI
ncbi:hypothetical protein BCR42DRAFT_415566 [Absidia repens]|uniref:Uncharacterized protein n=1 Tax=Absidia repens TaxID=90262 RepID=A0A1X2IFF4_9FUNG|nr:hypothetical protein BCR42DRAFT_415566 [Absidia repens]